MSAASKRADEWHIKIDQETKRRLKVYAAMHGLTLAAAIKQLLDVAQQPQPLAVDRSLWSDGRVRVMGDNHEQSGTD